MPSSKFSTGIIDADEYQFKGIIREVAERKEEMKKHPVSKIQVVL